MGQGPPEAVPICLFFCTTLGSLREARRLLLQQDGGALPPRPRLGCLEPGCREQGIHWPHGTDQEDLSNFDLSTYYVSVSVLSTGNAGRNKKNEDPVPTSLPVAYMISDRCGGKTREFPRCSGLYNTSPPGAQLWHGRGIRMTSADVSSYFCFFLKTFSALFFDQLEEMYSLEKHQIAPNSKWNDISEIPPSFSSSVLSAPQSGEP